MKLLRKESVGYVGRLGLGILLAMSCFLSAHLCASAENEKVVSAKTDGETIYLYVKGASGVADATVQIGTDICENVTVGGMDELPVPMRTVFLVDNSYSIQEEWRPDIQEILKAVVDGRMEGEEFRIGTFSDSVAWLCSYTADYIAVGYLLNNFEYVNQETYFNDCLYGVIEEMSRDADSVYSRVIIVSDGADDQAIGYTNQELSNLLGKSGIPVYTIGTKGDDSALENMFAFSRASKADYYLLDGSVGQEEIAASLLEDHQMSCIRITPDSALLDGSEKNIKVTLQTDQGDVTVTASAAMPFASQTAGSEEAQEPLSEPQESSDGMQEPAEASDVDGMQQSSGDSQQSMDVAANASEAAQEPKDSSGIFIAIGVGAVIVVVLVVVVLYLAVGRKKARRKAESGISSQNEAVQQKKKQVQDTKADIYTENEAKAQKGAARGQTMVLGGGNTRRGDTVSLWNQTAGQPKNTYLVLRDKGKPSSMFKVPIRNVIRIGRENADIVVDYDKYISARQCEITKRGESIYIKDLGSANGTFYEGKQVHDQEVPIASGGTIMIGESKFTVTIVTE